MKIVVNKLFLEQLQEMIDSGRLTEADIPDDWHWLTSTLDYFLYPGQTKEQRVKRTVPDYVTVDYALPEAWLYKAEDFFRSMKMTRNDVCDEVVWAYYDGSVFGEPFPLTERTQRLIQRMASVPA